MGWNEPGNDKDPWKKKNQPPDLDEAFKRLQAKLKKAFTGSSGSAHGKNDGGSVLLGVIIFLAALVIWALSGIFIVDPAEEAAILRFGKYVETVGPGPHWIPRFISTKIIVNISRVMDYSYSAQMLTKDENLVSVSLVVQYRIRDIEDYLFNVSDPIESLHQATSSSLRQVIGHTSLDEIITEGREAWGISVQQSLIELLNSYKTGIKVVNVSPQPARAPDKVQDAFDDAIKAQEDEKRFTEQARAYEARVVPLAKGNAKRIDAEARAYEAKVVLAAKGEVAEFNQLLPKYLAAPEVTGQRMYLETMQRILAKSSKIIIDSKTNNLLYLPMDQLLNASKQHAAAPSSSDEELASLNHMQSSADEIATFEGRPITRPTGRLGRRE